jgi:hypothetical protein
MAERADNLDKTPKGYTSNIEKRSEKVGYWIVRIGLPLLQIAIAYEVVQIAEGDFQTIVISVLGLIYCRLRAMSAEAAVNFYHSGYLTTFTSARIAVYLTSEPDRRMEDKLDEMVAEISKMNPDAQRTLRRIESGILNVIFALPLVKICLAHLLK